MAKISTFTLRPDDILGLFVTICYFLGIFSIKIAFLSNFYRFFSIKIDVFLLFFSKMSIYCVFRPNLIKGRSKGLFRSFPVDKQVRFWGILESPTFLAKYHIFRSFYRCFFTEKSLFFQFFSLFHLFYTPARWSRRVILHGNR